LPQAELLEPRLRPIAGFVITYDPPPILGAAALLTGSGCRTMTTAIALDGTDDRAGKPRQALA
jgi:hypothetical protein